MIDPTQADVGRKVVYRDGSFPGGNVEEGVITSFNDYFVFVRYGAGTGSAATDRADLEWITNLTPIGARAVADRAGDPTKQPPECKEHGVTRCPNMRETGGGFEGERYRCDVCGESYFLDYDEMR